MFTQEQLKAFVLYDHETGVFTRRVSRGKNQFGAEFARWKAGTVMGRINQQGYRRISIFGKVHQAHRLAWLYHYGEWPADQLDHINGDRSDNRIANLREATNAENGRNAKRPVDNKTGLIGVHVHTQNNRLIAQIRHDGKTYHLGCFDSIFEAACARRSAELRFGFHPNHGRAPSQTA